MMVERVEYREDGKLYDTDGNEYAGDNEYFNGMVKALDYLRENDLGDIKDTNLNILDDLLTSEEGVNVVISNPLHEDREATTRANGIEINPTTALKFGFGEMAKRNPSEVLLHELGHTWVYYFSKELRKFSNEKEKTQGIRFTQKWESEEEKWIIERIENVATDIDRKCHCGDLYQSLGPNTTKTEGETKKDK